MQKKSGKMKEYDHKKIESNLNKVWSKDKIYKTENNSKKKKCYVLDMFPYPSGAGLHVGHPRGYIGSDVYARMKRMQGYNVLHPMGFDAFGLPAEQYAIQTGKHPSIITKESIKRYRSQLDKIGFSYDWDRSVETIDPAYYKWTQWIFLKIYNSYFDTKKQKSFPIENLIKIFEKSGNKNVTASSTGGVQVFTAKEWKDFSKKEKQDLLMKYRLAYEGYAEVNWCPELGTVLANDEVIEKGGKLFSERGEHPVEKKSMRQWFMRIGAYADRLISGLEKLDFDESTKETQRNWIYEINEDGTKTLRMRDAIFARQRYWGEPIPLMHDQNGIITVVKTKDLPLELPKVTSYKPTGTGESPLSGVKSWVKEGYETNTMPGWAGSSWYFLRYMDPTNNKALASDKALKYWRDVDMYIGGTEHNTGHLLYARFWHKVLFDLGIVPTDEPFKALRHQGMIGGPDGRKMSKRWGNVINPDDIVATYGADTLRVYEMFLGPFDSHLPWSTESIIGSRRFIERVWRAAGKVMDQKSKINENVTYALNDVINKVTNDILDFKFNTAISSMMIFMGTLEKEECQISNEDFVKFLQILAPFAPYVTEEIYKMLGNTGTVHHSSWPKTKKLKERLVMQSIAVQVNGKLRGDIMVEPGASQETVVGSVMQDDRLRAYLEQGELLRTIYVPGKLVNFVVKVG
jgi:leucyl-tRNA synthetase